MSSSALLAGLCIMGVMWSAGPAPAADPEPCAGARTKLSSLSGPLRGTAVETLADLQKTFEDPGFKADVSRLLRDSSLGDLADPLFGAVALGEDVAKIELAPGTRFAWTAARDEKTAAPVRRESSCWNGSQPLDAWLITIPARDRKRDYAFVIPVTSANLALLAWDPPVCHLTVKKDCQAVTLDAGGSTPGARPITRYLWTIGGARKDTGEPLLRQPREPSLCPSGEPCRIEIAVQAVDQIGQRSQRCIENVELAPCPPRGADPL
jgi:hypothetical protein